MNLTKHKCKTYNALIIILQNLTSNCYYHYSERKIIFCSVDYFKGKYHYVVHLLICPVSNSETLKLYCLRTSINARLLQGFWTQIYQHVKLIRNHKTTIFLRRTFSVYAHLQWTRRGDSLFPWILWTSLRNFRSEEVYFGTPLSGHSV